MPLIAVVAVVAVFLPGLTAACGSLAAGGSRAGTPPASPGAPGARTSVTLKETGSSLLAPLMASWAQAYQAKTPGVTVATASTNSGTGISDASAGTADIGTSDAYLSSGDLVTNPTLLNIPLVISAQQVNYNVPGFNAPGQHIDLDGQVLALIYQGTITMWDDSRIRQLNPKLTLPPLAIVPFHRSDSSGDTFLFSSYLSTQDPAWNASIGYGTTVAWPAITGAKSAKGNMTMVDDCATVRGCVAYVGISYLNRADSQGLGEAALANAAGNFELPSPATIGAAAASFVSSTPPNETISMVDGPAPKGYPIVNYEYAIVSVSQRDPVKAKAIQAFLEWAITAGNSATFLTPVHFASLPPAVVQLAHDQIGRIG